jgi:gluconate kinase
MKKKVVILFGEMGAGKNYYGERIAEKEGLPFYDGDSCIPARMLEYTSAFKPIPRLVLVDYIDNYLLPEIIERTNDSDDGIVVAQALYLDNDRQVILATLEEQAFDVEYYWVKTPRKQNIKQLYSRKNGMRWAMYYLMNTAFFEKPTHTYRIVAENIMTDTIH